MMKVIFTGVSLFLSILVSLPAYSEPIRLTLWHPFSSQTPQYKAITSVKDEIENAMPVRLDTVRIQMSELSEPPGEIVRSGRADIAILPISELTRYAKEFQIFNILFLLKDHRQAADFQNYIEWRGLWEKLSEHGLIGLSWWGGEMMQIASRFPVLTPEDLKGERIIAISPEPVSRQLSAMGATTAGVPAAEVHAALERELGSITEVPLSQAAEMTSVAPNITLSNHRFRGWAVVADARRWRTLPESVSRSLRELFQKEARGLSNVMIQSEHDLGERLKKSPRLRVFELTGAEISLWKLALADETRKIVDQVGEELYGIARYGMKEMAKGMPSRPYPRRETSWNIWFEDAISSRDAPVPILRGRYRLNIDLSRYAYRQRYAARPGGETLDAIAELEKIERAEIRLLLQPVLYGKNLTAPMDAPLDPKVLILKKARTAEAQNEAEILARFVNGEISTRQLAEVVNLGGIVSWEVIAKQAGCGTLDISVWDEASLQPLDHLVFHFPVQPDATTPVSGCEVTAGTHLAAGLKTFLFTTPENRGAGPHLADAALHIFESKFGGRIRSTAVFVDRDRYIQAASGRETPDHGVYSWTLYSVLSNYIFEEGQFRELLGAAHRAAVKPGADNYPFAEVAAELALKIFSGETEIDQEQADRALASFRNLLERAADPIVLVRLTSADGGIIYLPLGLLAASAAKPTVPKGFTVVQPLSHLHPSGGEKCVELWTNAIPKKLEGIYGDAEDVLINLPRTPVPGFAGWIENNEDLEAFLSGRDDMDAGTGMGLGLILLAHHDMGSLWFTKSDHPTRIVIERIRRKFPSGSAAVLAACSVSGKTPESRSLVERLNGQGVEAMIISPFAVDPEFGTRMALEYLSAIAEARRGGGDVTLLALHQTAMAKTIEAFKTRRWYSDMAKEFQIIGRYDLRMCKPR